MIVAKIKLNFTGSRPELLTKISFSYFIKKKIGMKKVSLCIDYQFVALW